MSIFFPILGKFSAIIPSNKFSDPFSFSSSSQIHIMPVLLGLMISLGSLNVLSFIIFFSFYCFFWLISITLISRFLIHSVSSNLLLIPLVFFLILVSEFLHLKLVLFYIFYLSIEIQSLCTLCSSPVSIFMTIVLNFLSGIFLISVSFNSFAVVCPFL